MAHRLPERGVGGTVRPAQVFPSHGRVPPDQLERRRRAPAASGAVVQRVGVRAEVAARPVDRFTDGAVEAFDVGDVPSVDLVGGAGWLVRGVVPVVRQRCHRPLVSEIAGVARPSAGFGRSAGSPEIPDVACPVRHGVGDGGVEGDIERSVPEGRRADRRHRPFDMDADHRGCAAVVCHAGDGSANPAAPGRTTRVAGPAIQRVECTSQCWPGLASDQHRRPNRRQRRRLAVDEQPFDVDARGDRPARPVRVFVDQ
ncbi:hypothetical protein EDC02_4694 [Micromonospora sp. Llam0]|nr:hypothetical protein EDC02_4694 [Micromonospora sp. Llam0]